MVQTATADGFYTSREAAALLDVSVKTAQLWVESGILQAWKTPGGHRRITRRSVEDLLSQRERASAPALAPAANRSGTAPASVLIVEDDPQTRKVYDLTMSHWGLPIELTAVSNGFDALLQIGANKPAIVITDLNMPGMDGFRLVRALRGDRAHETMKIIVVSGLTPDQIRQAGGLPKDVTVLAKPIPFNDLRKEIESHLVR